MQSRDHAGTTPPPLRTTLEWKQLVVDLYCMWDKVAQSEDDAEGSVRFYVGLHRLTLARHFKQSFISVNILRKRRSYFEVGDWIMDSGAFTEISKYGHYRSGVSEYAAEVERWKERAQR